MSDRLQMLTFAPMVDSETTRLLARYYRLAVEERDHLFGWVSLLTLLHGGRGLIPLVYGKGVRATGPWAVAQHFDARLPAGNRLVPCEAPLSIQAEADWARFNGKLGTDVAVFAYYHLLPARSLMAPIFAAPVPAGEARLVPAVYGLLRGAFTLALKLSAKRATAAAAHIRSCFDMTDRRIADGRPYLCGDRLTIGDVALAAASAPLLQPRGFGTVMPPLDAMPAPVRTLVEELRARPTARFIQGLYDSEFG